MVGIRLIVIMAIVGGFIAYIADKMGSKIGKRKMSIFGLRPRYTSVLLTVISGTLIAVLTVAVMAVASDSARTALFGMEQLQQDLRKLDREKQEAAGALAEVEEKLKQQNQKISELDAKIAESTKENDAMEASIALLSDKYQLAQNEVASLSDAKAKLTEEVGELEKTTARLREGIVNIREGQVFYRAGEVVFAAVLRGGLSHEENILQVNWLLQNANEAALERLGVDPDKQEKTVQIIWIAKTLVTEAVKALDESKGNLFFRIRTAANIIVGEMVVCNIEAADNQFIYPDGTLILSADYDTKGAAGSAESALAEFLALVNRNAVNAGVLPDPMTGKVGNLDAYTMIEAASVIRKTKGKFTLNAYANGDITTAGPVRVRLEVIPHTDDAQEE